MTFAFDYEVKATGTIKIEADSEEQAREVFETFKEFELYDDSTNAKIKVLKIKKT